MSMSEPDSGGSTSRDGGKSRREFISRGSKLLYVAPLVISYDISEIYNESEGHKSFTSPYPHHHGEK